MRRTALGLLAVQALAAGCLLAAGAGHELVVLHVNDLHGYIDERKDSRGEPFGGMARLAGALEQSKRRALGRHARWLFVSGGDFLQGAPAADETSGACAVDLLNRLRLLASAPGNHEFDFGPAVLGQRAREARFPLLAANLEYSGPHEFPFSRSLLTTVGGLRVGLTGAVTPDTKSSNLARNVAPFEFLEPGPAVAREAALLRRRGADVVILLSHQGLPRDRELAAQVPGLDLVVGAHSHTPLATATQVGPTIVVQAGENCEHLGEVRLEVRPGGSGTRLLGYRLIPLRADAAPPEPETAAAVRRWVAPIERQLASVVGELAVELPLGLGGDFSPAASLVATAMKEAFPVELAFFYPRGVRRGLPRGPITLGLLREALPYGNEMVTMRMDGASIRKAVERGLGGAWSPYEPADGPAIAKRLNGGGLVSGMKPSWTAAVPLQAAGLSYTFEPSRPEGRRTVDLRVGGVPLEPGWVYSVAANSYLADGSTDRPEFAAAQDVRWTGIKDRDVVADYLRTHRPVPAVPEKTVTNLANRMK